MNYTTIFFFADLLPVALAFIAIPLMARALVTNASSLTLVQKIGAHMAILSCVLLIIAQSGWINAQMNGHVIWVSIMDRVWTFFNTFVMISFLCLTKSFKK
jgi:hypothetical protein